MELIIFVIVYGLWSNNFNWDFDCRFAKFVNISKFSVFDNKARHLEVYPKVDEVMNILGKLMSKWNFKSAGNPIKNTCQSLLHHTIQ